MTALERLADLAGGMMLDTARVTGVSRLSDDFVRVELAADAFRKATWVPGGVTAMMTGLGPRDL
jgi:ferric-chelate reductase (NADPH)